MTKPLAIGVDIGGTKIAAGVVDRTGQVLSRFSTKSHAEQPPDVVMATVKEAVENVLASSDRAADEVAAVGIGFPGNTNGRAGVVLTCSNLPAWDHFPLRDVLANQLGLPVILDNDTNMAVVGEHQFGAAQGVDDVCYVTVSTGMGAGVMVRGRVYAGYSGSAGEVGHAVVQPNGAMCSCGKRGCVMAYASGVGISRMAYERVAAGDTTQLRDVMRPDGRRIPVEDVVRVAGEGDLVAQEILSTAAQYCGLGLSIIIQVLSPEMIVVGGGLTRMGSLLMDPALAAMRENTQPELLEFVRVVPWQLGDDLGILGGAASVFAEHN